LPWFFVAIATHIRRTFHEGKPFFLWYFFCLYIHVLVFHGNNDDIIPPRVTILKRGILFFDGNIATISMEKHGNSDEQCARVKTPPLACDADAILAAVKAWQVAMKDHRNSDAQAWQRKTPINSL
jgi:hypothetical protein